MRISLLIPTRNRPKELKKNLKSVFDCTIHPFEVIVSDDSDQDISAGNVSFFGQLS